MQEPGARYARAVAGAAFVLIWTTLGLTAALLAGVAAVVASEAPRVRALAPRRRPRPRTRRVRELPLVPDEPSLVLTVSER